MIVKGTVDRAVRLDSHKERGLKKTALYFSDCPEVVFAFCPEYSKGTKLEVSKGKAKVIGANNPGVLQEAKQLEKLFELSKGKLPFNFYEEAAKAWPYDCGDRYESNPFCLKVLFPKNSHIFEDIANSLTISTFSNRINEVTEAAIAVLELTETLKGSTWTPYDALEKQVINKLACVGHPLKEGELAAYLRFSEQIFYIVEPICADSPVALRTSYNNESAIALEVKRTTQLETPYGADAEKENLSEEQLNAVNGVLKSDGRFAIITGGPGTGKTTVIKSIVKGIRRNNPDAKIAILAPTGKATKRAIESMSDLNINITETVAKFTLGKSDGRETYRQDTRKRTMSMDLVIVDEASMLDAGLAVSLIDHVDTRKAKIVFVGDVDQLASISAGAVLRDLINAGIPTYYLTQNFRSATSIISNAKKINNGDAKLKKSDSFVIEEEEITSDSLFSQIIKGDESVVLVPYREPNEKSSLSSISINAMLQIAKNPNGRQLKWGFREGDPIVFTRNNYPAGYMNGETGVAIGINENSGDLVVKISDETEVFVKDQYDIDLGYAITVHKSQGSEYDSVLVMLDNSPHIDRRAIYTAVTRAKNKVRIVATPGAIEKAISNTSASQRNTVLDLLLSSALR